MSAQIHEGGPVIPERYTRWNAADYLKTKADMDAYLNACIELNDPRLVADAMKTIARAQRALRKAINRARYKRQYARRGAILRKEHGYVGG